jgi:hypothetical protein
MHTYVISKLDVANCTQAFVNKCAVYFALVHVCVCVCAPRWCSVQVLNDHAKEMSVNETSKICTVKASVAANRHTLVVRAPVGISLKLRTRPLNVVRPIEAKSPA